MSDRVSDVEDRHRWTISNEKKNRESRNECALFCLARNPRFDSFTSLEQIRQMRRDEHHLFQFYVVERMRTTFRWECTYGTVGLKMGTEITATAMPWKRTPRKRENVKYKSKRNIELRQQWWIRCFYRIRAAKERDKFHSGCDAFAGSQSRTLLAISCSVKAKAGKVEIDRTKHGHENAKKKK